ncbi:MAG: PEP-CTERM sorting domain-containing protein [Fimbriimonadales bacterium]
MAQEVGSAFDDADQLWMIVSGGRTYTVDTTTGEATFVANIVDVAGAPLFGFERLAITPVPKPTTIAALTFGMGILAIRRRR